MKDSVQPPLVVIAGALNILGGLLTFLVGLAYLMLCYGIIVIPVGIWQVIVGGLACTGKRVPSHLTATLFGMFMCLITFNLIGLFLGVCAAGLLVLELTMKAPDA